MKEEIIIAILELSRIPKTNSSALGVAQELDALYATVRKIPEKGNSIVSV